MTSRPGTADIFVGRQQEMAELEAALEDALSGRGRLVMLAGEPGIGKTRTTQELATLAEQQGAQVLWGWCSEEGSLPYLPFVEIMRTYVLSRDSDLLRQELGSGASDVARIVSEVRDKLAVELREPGDPEEDRYRLFQAVSDFLKNAAQPRPLMLVLEDLQDADRGTLDLLTHVARNLAGARLLIVGTYRDVEVDRAHPLSGALANLRRIPDFSRVLLRGLALDEVQRMVETSAGPEIPLGLAEAMERQTEGNPLFVQEVLRYLVDEGLVQREGGSSVEAEDASVERLVSRIPEGLRDVIGKRLSRLSEECNRLLAVASVIGREFPLSVLQRVAQGSEEELDSSLEEALNAVVIEERSSMGGTVNYWFTHAFFRQTMYEEIIAPRRFRLHHQVAQALEEQYPTRLEEHASELAEHFSYSSDANDLAKAVGYYEVAAERSMSVYAFGEAVRLLERALQIQELLDLDDQGKRCDLLLSLGDAMILAGEPRRFLDAAGPEALSLAEAMGDGIRASRVCQMAILALYSYLVAAAFRTPEGALWAERADRYAQPDTVERAWADMGLGAVRYNTGDPGQGYVLLNRALILARRLDDPDTFWRATGILLIMVDAPQHGEEGLHLAEELAEQSRAGVSMLTLVPALLLIGFTFLVWGQRARAEEMWRELGDLGRRTGQGNALLTSMQTDATLATLDGRLEDSLATGQHIRVRGAELGLSDSYADGVESRATLRSLLYLGKGEDALQLGGFPPLPRRALCLAHLGRDAEVVAILEQLVLARPGIGSKDAETRTMIDIFLLEAAVLVKHNEAADLLQRRIAGSGIRTPWWAITCIARHMGGAAVLLGRPVEARAHYQTALEVCQEVGFRPEIALTRLQLAELLLEHYPEERADALEHLDFAIVEFREMAMQPSLVQAIDLREQVEAQPVWAPAYPDGLTQREVEVLRLVATGKTDREIAEELFISAATVSTHVRNLLNKTGVANRTEATAYAARQGLIE